MKLFVVFLGVFFSASTWANDYPKANDPNWIFSSQFNYQGGVLGGMSWSDTILPVGQSVSFLKIEKPSYCHPASQFSVSVEVPASISYLGNDRTPYGDNFIFSVSGGQGYPIRRLSLGYNGKAMESCTYTVSRMLAVASLPYPEGEASALVTLKKVSVNGVTTHKWAYESCYEAIRRSELTILSVEEAAPYRLVVRGLGKSLYELPVNLSCVEAISWKD